MIHDRTRPIHAPASAAERQQADRARATAEKAIADTTAAYHLAEDKLANYDRPLHRRKHATEIAEARLDIERLPAAVKTADNELNVAVCRWP